MCLEQAAWTRALAHPEWLHSGGMTRVPGGHATTAETYFLCHMPPLFADILYVKGVPHACACGLPPAGSHPTG